MSFTAVLTPSQTVTQNGFSATIQGQALVVGALFYVNVTAATSQMNLKLQSYDPASATWVDVAQFGLDITTTGLNKFVIYPGAAGAIYEVLPAQSRIYWTLSGGGTPSFTFSIGLSYL